MPPLTVNTNIPDRPDSGQRSSSKRTPNGSTPPSAAKTAEVGTAESPKPLRLRAQGVEGGAQELSAPGTGSTGRPTDLEVASLFPGSPSVSSLGSPLSRGRSRDQARDTEDLQAMLLGMSQRSVPWNPEQWLEARQQLLDQGRVTELPALMRCVRQTSERALKMRGYQTEGGEVSVDLRDHLMIPESVKWFGRRNVEVPPMPAADKSKVEPPIIVVDQSPLDLVSVISGFDGIQKHPISIVAEVTDGFDDNGMLNVNSTRSVPGVIQNLSCRTDFARFAEAAHSSLRSGRATIRDHLTAHHDPYVFVAPDCTMIRGDREEGYPFLEHPVHMRAIVCSMASTRPSLMTSTNRSTLEKTEWYASDMDQTALLERLSLIGFAALQDHDPGTKSILILSALGCTERGLHPRHAVANSLKHWRSRFARLFHAVFLACGPDRDLAAQFDLAINRQVYSTLVTEDAADFIPWHWDRRYLALHINFHDLSEIAMMVHGEGNVEDESESEAGDGVVPTLSICKASPKASDAKKRNGGNHLAVENAAPVRRRSLLEDFSEVMKEHEHRSYKPANQAEEDITELYLETERMRRRSVVANQEANQALTPSSTGRLSCNSQHLLDPNGRGGAARSRASSFCSAANSPRSRGGASTLVEGPRRLSMSSLMENSRGRRLSIEHRMGARRASFQTTGVGGAAAGGGRRASQSRGSDRGGRRNGSRRSSRSASLSSGGSGNSDRSRASQCSRASNGLFSKIQDKFKKLTVKEYGRTKPKVYKPTQAPNRGEKIRGEFRRRLSTSKADADAAAAAASASAAASPTSGAAAAEGSGSAAADPSRPRTVPSERKAQPPAVPPATAPAGGGRGAITSPGVWGETAEEKAAQRGTLTAGESLRLKVNKQAVMRRAGGGSFNPAMMLAAGLENIEQTSGGGNAANGPPSPSSSRGSSKGHSSSQMPSQKPPSGLALQNVILAAAAAQQATKEKAPEEWQVRMDLHDLAAAFKARSEEIQTTGRKTMLKAVPRVSEFQQRRSKLGLHKRKSSLKDRAARRDPTKGFENAMMADLAHSQTGVAPEPDGRGDSGVSPAGWHAKEAASPPVKDGSTVLPPVVLHKVAPGQLPTPQSARPSSRTSGRQGALQADMPAALDTARGSSRSDVMMRKMNRMMAEREAGNGPRAGSRLDNMGDVGAHNLHLRG